MIELHIDFETYSPQKLGRQQGVGAYRYANDPAAEILLMAVAFGDGEPELWVPEMYESELCRTSPGLERRLAEVLSLPDEEVIVWAHNAGFEIAITKYLWEKTFGGRIPAPRLSQWRCTKALALRAALPNSLENIGTNLLIDTTKDKRGEQLITKFCKPRKPTKANAATRIYPWDAPEDFAAFGEYCLQDVRVEQQVGVALADFNLKTQTLDAFQLHNRINDRGLPVNVQALQNAQKIIDDAAELIREKFSSITGFNPSQRDKCIEWLQERGYPGEDLKANTIEKYLEDDTWGDGKSRQVLSLRAASSFAAVKKIKSMLACSCDDDLVRGTLEYYGAFRTGRGAGRLIQPQNYKRPTIKNTDLAYQMIKAGCSAEEIFMVHGNPLEVVASCIRHFIEPPDGAFYDADYAGIEARIVCWLAGQEDALREFRAYDAKEGPNVYEIMAAFIFNIPMSQIDKDGIERFIGKQTVLGGGFGMGPEKFVLTCATYGKEIELEMAQIAIAGFREKNAKVASLWRKTDQAARAAIASPGQWFKAGEKIRFARSIVKSCNIDYLIMRLPSGRMLAYPYPAIERVAGKKGDQITFLGMLPNKSNAWGRISTYGAKLVENATQATAADFMMHGATVAEKQGFEICTLIHDEAVARKHPTLTIDDFCEALCTLPKWAEGMPLVAEGKIIPYYLKA